MSKRCIKCGVKLPDEASFCPNCMTSQVEREHIEPPKPRRKKPLLTLGLLVLAAAAAALAIWLAGRGGQQPAGPSASPPVSGEPAPNDPSPVSNEPVSSDPGASDPGDPGSASPTPAASGPVAPASPAVSDAPTVSDAPAASDPAAPTPSASAPSTAEPEPSGALYEGEAQLIYTDGEDRYELLLMLNGIYPPFPEAVKEVQMAADTTLQNPSQLYVTQTSGTGGAEGFLDKVARYSVETVPLDGAQQMRHTAPAPDRNYPHALLVSTVTYTAACGTNEIVWTLEMKNGDTLRLTHRIEVTALTSGEYHYETTPMETDAQLQALLARIAEETSPDTVIDLYLPAVTYRQPVSFTGRKFNLYGSTSGGAQTTFAASVTVNSGMAGRGDVQNIRFSGSGGTGLTASSGLLIQYCQFDGWDTGVLSAEGSWVTVAGCSFSGNQVGFEFDSSYADFTSTTYFNNQFTGNGTALLLTRVPGSLTLDFSNSVFRGNQVDIHNINNYPVDLSNARFE